MNLIQEILSWSKTLPLWQQDAVRRLFSSPKGLSDTDIIELAELCLKENGLLPGCSKTSKPLVQASIPTARAGVRLAIKKLHGLKNVNCIDPQQELEFAENGMTVVYGVNGSGKSGYARVIKRACFSRDRGERILPDVKDVTAVNKIAEATFDIDENGVGKTYAWQDGSFIGTLSGISVFDAQSARVVLDQAQDCRYIPYGLDIVQDVGNKVVPKVRAVIEAQAAKIDLSEEAFKNLKGDHAVGRIFGNLANADISEIRCLANFSSADMNRGKELTSLIDKQAGVEIIKTIRQKVDRIKQLSSAIKKAAEAFCENEIKKLKDVFGSEATARAAAVTAAKIFADETEFLKGTGSEPWKVLFESARRFADEYCGNGNEYPEGVTRCVLCQQELGDAAVRRLKKFDAYVKEDASRNAENASKMLSNEKVRVERLPDGMSADDVLIKELSDIDNTIAQDISTYQVAFAQQKAAVLRALNGEIDWDTLSSLDISVSQKLRKLASHELRRAHQIRLTIDETKRAALIKERDELRVRLLLHRQIKAVEDWFVRRNRRQALLTLAKTLTTAHFTKKAKELFAGTVTKPLLDALDEEFSAIGVSKIRLKPSLTEKGEKSKVFMKLVIPDVKAIPLASVLSEGEQRAVAVASFLAELKTAGHENAIVFDDPMSSMDVAFREAVAKRLANESMKRQVIVFSHDPLFVCQLRLASQDVGNHCAFRYLEPKIPHVGYVTDGLPWDSCSIESRIDRLEKDQKKLEKLPWPLYPTDEQKREMRSVYDRLRASIEQFVRDKCLGGVIRRYDDYVRVESLRMVLAMDQVLVSRIMKLYSRCHKIIEAHDHTSAGVVGIPTDQDLKNDIAEFRKLNEEVKVAQKLLR